tara:strand:+ start:5316 stop:5888 length:573 start_codon:yes stop_codon:yes gene_type:complete
MFKKVFFINHAPKEFHNLLVVLVVSGMLLTPIYFFYGEKTVYKTSTVGQTEKTFKIAYKEFTKDGYNGSKAQFDSLLKVNSEAVEIAFKLVDKDYSLGSLYTPYLFSNKREKFKYLLGLPFEYYNKVPDWIGRFSAFASCWVVIGLSLLFLNFTLKPIANRYKYFWFVPYILSIAIPSIFGVIVMLILAG